MQMSLKRLGEYLRKLRPENQPSLREIAERSGLNEHFLYKLERGVFETVKLDTLRLIAKGYGVPVEKLLAESGIVNWDEPALPDLDVYLRTKFGLTDQAIEDLKKYKEFVERKYGAPRRQK